MNFVVVSTAFRPTDAMRARCLQSVLVQTVPARHIYIADEISGYHLENLYHAVHALDPSDVVLSVDGDDSLLDPDAIAIVSNAYHHGAWMTWGQYARYESGRCTHAGHAHDRKNRRTCRKDPWYASHLKTYRAGLFQQIRKESLFRNGTWLSQCCDLAVMWPMLEMADDRGTFIHQPIYAYDYTERRARKHDVPGTALYKDQIACIAYLRSLPVYPRLETAPW